MPARSEGRSRAARAVVRGAPALVAALAAAAPGRAADTEPIRIVYSAPPGCPDEAAFTGQVTARTRRARVAAAGEAARTFTVHVAAAGARTRGRLTIEDPEGPPAARDVSGGTCDEVVSALGLIVALAVDPHASTAPTPPPSPPPVPPPPPPAPKPEPLPPPPPYAPLPWWGPLGTPLPVIPAPEPETRWRFGAGVRLGGSSGVAPGQPVTFLGGAYAEIARYGGGLLSPAFRLGYSGRASGDVVFDAAHGGSLALHTARAEGCPIRLEALPTVALLPCVVLEAGALIASGQGTTARPWVAPGTAARIQWEALPWLRVEAEGGVNVRAIRSTFRDGSTPVYSIPPAGGFFAAGVGVHFP